jgi:hypothetical protein
MIEVGSMSSSHRWKILAVLLLVVVVLASVGSYQIWNQAVRESTSNLSSTGSLQATLSSTTQPTGTTSVSYPPIQWITIGKVQPVSYYLTLLQSNGTEPYVQLAAELQKLPEFEPYPQFANATAVAEISYLALNATNPEVKEAFQLMMKGGTVNRSDFRYPIPQYNTELEILYWLANGRQLKRDDTLALAISMSNGIWITIGDESVQAQVRKDVVDSLDFFRETNELQQSFGYPRLEEMPLEAKVALAWLGGDTGTHGPHAITGSQTMTNAVDKPMNLASYEWDNVNITTLRQMRDYIRQEGWGTSSIDATVATIEDYFFFSGLSEHYDYVSSWDVTIQVNGETVPARNMDNANFNFQYYLKNGKAIGVCEDEMTLVSALLKSWGIATLPQMSYWVEGNGYEGHTYTMFYDPNSRAWKVTPYQIGLVFSSVQDAYIFLPPILQNEFIPTSRITPQEAAVPYPFQTGEVNTLMFVPMYNITGSYLNRYVDGVGTDQVKQWILYKVMPPKAVTAYSSWNFQGPWNVINDRPKDLVDQNGGIVGDLGQPYVDLANLSYGHSNESLFFRFTVRGDIPSQLPPNVNGIWYQVLLDVGSDSQTGYYWSNNFTPDYILQFSVMHDPNLRSNPIVVQAELLKHCGEVDDWCWTPVGFTQRYGPTTLVSGGTGSNSFVLFCDYGDVTVSQGSTIKFFGRSEINYDGQVYNDYAPLSGTVSMTL